MGLTTMFLREWREGRRKKLRAEFEKSTPPTVSLADLPMAGARWRRNPDGSWMRWSYLGEDWEPQAALPALLQAAEQTPGVIDWTVGPNGAWKPYDPEKPPTSQAEQVEEKPAEQLPPPAAPPKLDPGFTPRPEWTSDWQPGWKEDLK
jgi:hypothetical protein